MQSHLPIMRVMFQAHHDRHDEHMQQVQMERREAGLVAAAASTIGSLFLLALALAIVADRVHISVGDAIFIVINGTFASIIVGMFTSHQVGYSKAMAASLSPWLLSQPQPTTQHRTTSLNGQRTSPILNPPHHRTPPRTLQHALARKWKNRNLDLAVQSVLCSLYVYLIILVQVGLERRGVQRRYIEVRGDRSVYGVYLTTTHSRNLQESSKSLHLVIVVALVDNVLDCNH